jgi:large subunit ribosomal protein L4
LAAVLSKKFVDQEVIFVDSLAMGEPKTKEAKAIVSALAKGSGMATLATKRKNAALVILSGRDVATEKSFRNFGNIEVTQAKDVNPVDLLTYKYVVVADPASSVEIFEKRVGSTAAKA